MSDGVWAVGVERLHKWEARCALGNSANAEFAARQSGSRGWSDKRRDAAMTRQESIF